MKTKMLNGAEIAGYMKANQQRRVRSLQHEGVQPKLVILRDNDNPVITKYVRLKQKYGEDIGVVVEDWLTEDLAGGVEKANAAEDVQGMIVQLPIKDMAQVDEIVAKITPEKDVDGLNPQGEIFESATATAIAWLLTGYDIDLKGKKIALVGRGRLVGGPLAKMWQKSGYEVTTFGHDSDLEELSNYEIIVTATGVPHLIKSEMIAPGAVVVDAGTASEGGILVGDLDDAVRERDDLKAITPKSGGVGPLTVAALFEHVLAAAI